MNRSRGKLLAFAGLLIAVVVLVLAVIGGPVPGGLGSAPDAGPSAPGPTATSSTTLRPATPPPAAGNSSGLPPVNASELPAEARQTLALIAKGGPYPYTRDGVNFGNFEGLLPRKPGGYYKEYTVKTPGESDRGARRIIAGEDGARYYTPDHYNSFKFIVEGK